MSRTVNYQNGAELVKFTHVEAVYGEYNPDTGEYEGEEYNELATRDAFEDTIGNIQYALKHAFPSFDEVPADRDRQNCEDRRAWEAADRECWPILLNGSCVVYLSEYYGLFSISFVPRDEVDGYDYNRLGLQKHWLRTAEKRIDAAIESVAERLLCLGHFSNGEGVYAPATARRAQLAAAVNGEAL